MIKESIKMSWQNIVHNKMRSFLTTLGIVIGVTAIIALVTIVQGVTGEVTSQFSSLGAGKITVQAFGTPLKQGLSDNDLKKLMEIENVSGISPTLSMEASVVRNTSVEEDVPVDGKNEVFFQNNTDLIVRGRALNKLDMENKNKVSVINQTLEELLFFGEDSVGQTMQINGITYTVVGVLDEDAIADVTAMMANSTDSEGKVIIPYTTAMGIAGVSNISSFEVLIADTDKTDEVIEDTELVLNQAFNYKENSFNIINMDSLLDTMNSMTGMLTAMMAGIASIALLVGGIGIMNMMLVSVTERTTEIGLRKALGAEPKRIQLQFLIESIVLSLLGGIIGLLLGVGISWAVTAALDITFVMSTWAIALGVGFSAGVGIIFGWAPARKASMLNPIDALRSV
ncbi:MAG: ABC transporter permease [Clostridia bacterium BRH_c25]|nr:MAG: ABC transporter permease [Clostridia bacterium BRH_c25]